MTSPTAPTVLLSELVFVESARWHQGRLWFAHWTTGEIIALDPDGAHEVVARGPEGMGWSIDWLPDGRLLTTGPGLDRHEPDGSVVRHADTSGVADHGWNEIALDGRGNIYLDGMSFDFLGGAAPTPGVIALVTPTGEVRKVAEDIEFPNGMVVTPDDSTLIVAESFANRLTAFDIGDDGDLTNRRVWAQNVAPDGICLDAEGAVWVGATDTRMFTGRADQPGGALIRVREGGEVLDRVEVDRPVFSATLGGPDGHTLFMLATEWRGVENVEAVAAERTGRVLASRVDVPGANTGAIR